MTKRLITFIFSIIACTTLLIADEYNVKLNRQDKTKEEVKLDFAIVTFEFASDYDTKVSVTIENTTNSYGLLLFKDNMSESVLKKRKPKIEFDKSFGGEKNHRYTEACENLSEYVAIIPPAQKVQLFTTKITERTDTIIKLPIYVGKYDAKKWKKKIPILRQYTEQFILQVDNWSENDPTYVSTKNAIADFRRSLIGVNFCTNKKHSPSLSEQEKPYIETKEKLIARIDSIERRGWWMSTDKPGIAYKALRDELVSIDFTKMEQDCGNHKSKPKPKPTGHNCGYCSLSAEQIYHRLDDTYQQLHTGRITKDAAVKTAQSLYKCFNDNKSRNKSGAYTSKINEYYNRIIRY